MIKQILKRLTAWDYGVAILGLVSLLTLPGEFLLFLFSLIAVGVTVFRIQDVKMDLEMDEMFKEIQAQQQETDNS